MIVHILIITLFRRKNLRTLKTNGVPLSQLCTMKYYHFKRQNTDYMINIDRSKMLDSSFFENLVWGALHKAWKGYVIAKNKGEDNKIYYRSTKL